jgi:iron-sulfur cluster repair protein YtfE (RIC family)
MSTDAIVLLRADHKEIRRLFREFLSLRDSEARKGTRNGTRKKASLVKQIISMLTMHTYIENEVMYPEVRARLPELDEAVLEGYEEHHVADVLSMELYGMPARSERFTPKAVVLIENFTHHMEEEERDWFPKVRAGLGRRQLLEIGAKLQEARRKAPKSPAQPSALKKTIDAVIS